MKLDDIRVRRRENDFLEQEIYRLKAVMAEIASLTEEESSRSLLKRELVEVYSLIHAKCLEALNGRP